MSAPLLPSGHKFKHSFFTHKLSEDGPNQLTVQLPSAQFKQRFKQLSSYFSCCELLFYPPIYPSLHVCLSAHDVSDSVSVIPVVTDAFILHGPFMLLLFLSHVLRKNGQLSQPQGFQYARSKEGMSQNRVTYTKCKWVLLEFLGFVLNEL